MHADQQPYRQLYDAILDGSSNVYDRYLAPWLKSSGEKERAWLCHLASSVGRAPWPDVEVEVLWRLYALSRINQILLLAFQHGDVDGDWEGPDVSAGQYLDFFGRLGLEECRHQVFHPFFHEIVQVEDASDENEPPRVHTLQWPCLMLGKMMFSRAGCTIRTGRAWIDKAVAESSTLYWAFRRKHRDFQDLSDGWGGNSQWRTSFRRDFCDGERYYYNVDGEQALNDIRGTDENGLSHEERLELLRHRCLVTHSRPDEGDLWVYDYTHVEG